MHIAPDDAARLPSPLREGSGVGVPRCFTAARYAHDDPHPLPLPARGRGGQRATPCLSMSVHASEDVRRRVGLDAVRRVLSGTSLIRLRCAGPPFPASGRRCGRRPDAKRNPLQRVRHELRRTPVPGPVAPPGRSLRRLHLAPPLGRPRRAARAGEIRRDVFSRRARRLRRLRRFAGCGAARRRAGAGERSDDAGAGDGARHRAPRLRCDGKPFLRAALRLRAAPVDARPSHAWPHRLEHRHRLPRFRGARHRRGEAGGARRPLRRRRRVSGNLLQAVGDELGGRCGAARPRRGRLRRPRQGAPRRASRRALRL